VKSVEEALLPARQIIESEIETDVNRFNEETIPVTESFYEDIINEKDINNDEQVEETTELGPVFRKTSRGRLVQIHRSPKKIEHETETQSINENSSGYRPVPQPRLIENPNLRQINAIQSAFAGDSENRPTIEFNTQIGNTPRRQEIRNRPIPTLIEDPSLRQINTRRPVFRRPGLRNRPGIRRIPVTNNNLLSQDNQEDTETNRRTLVRRPALSARLRGQLGYTRVRRT